MASTKLQSSLFQLKQALYNHGFDIYHEFCVQKYNKLVVKNNDKLLPLPTYNKQETLGLLIGNTKYLWPIFIKELKEINPQKYKHMKHPLNEYTKISIENICNNIFSINKTYNNNKSLQIINDLINNFDNKIEYEIRYYWEIEKSKLISFQKLCDISNLAFLDKQSYLCIHEKYGPWFALRCVIILNMNYNEKILNSNININNSYLLSKNEKEKVKKQWNIIKEKLFDNKNSNVNDIPSWKYWLELRNCYDIGKEYKYNDNQILYHYTTNLNVLQEICNWS